MAKDYIRRTLDLFSVHGRSGDELVDYKSFFEQLSELSTSERFLFDIDGVKVTFVKAVHVEDNLIAYCFISGETDDPVMYYDISEKQQREINSPNGFFSFPVWLFVNTQDRFIARENRRPGVPVRLIEKYFQLSAVKFGYSHPRFDVNPVADSHFLEAIQDLEIIDTVGIDMARPNYDWSEDEARLTNIADASNASTISVQVKSKSGQSLAKNSGIVKDVKTIVKEVRNGIKNVRIHGKRTKESLGIWLNQSRFQRKAAVALPSHSSEDEKLSLLAKESEILISDAVQEMHNQAAAR